MNFWLKATNLHIEQAKISHAYDCAMLHKSAFYRGWTIQEFEIFLSDPKNSPIFISLNKRGKMAGFAIIKKAGSEAELLSIVVNKKWRSKGVGRTLLKALIDDLFNSSVEELFLEVDENNKSAIHLYKNFGFLEVGKREGYYRLKNGKKTSALVMALKLD